MRRVDSQRKRYHSETPAHRRGRSETVTMATKHSRFKDVSTPAARAGARSRKASPAPGSLGALRRQVGLSQVELAGALGVTQHSVSALESRDDPRISTVRAFVEALGGELELVAVVGRTRYPLELGGADG